MTGEEFARLLALRLQAIVPVGFTVRAESKSLVFATDPGVGHFGGRSGNAVGEHFEMNAGTVSVEERAVWAGEMALESLQDYVDEESTEPWPGKKTPPSAHAEVRGRMLYLWFGDHGSETVMCEPIEIT